jgi:hypothetical protein
LPTTVIWVSKSTVGLLNSIRSFSALKSIVSIEAGPIILSEEVEMDKMGIRTMKQDIKEAIGVEAAYTATMQTICTRQVLAKINNITIGVDGVVVELSRTNISSRK